MNGCRWWCGAKADPSSNTWETRSAVKRCYKKYRGGRGLIGWMFSSVAASNWYRRRCCCRFCCCCCCCCCSVSFLVASYLRIFGSSIFIVKFLFLQQVVLVIKPGTAFSPSSQPKRFAGSCSDQKWTKLWRSMVDNSQEYRLKYWATLLSVRSFARLLAPLTRSLTRSIRSLPRSWESEWLDGYFFCVSV